MRNSCKKIFVPYLSLIAIVGITLPAYAQRERPTREERQDQRQERRVSSAY